MITDQRELPLLIEREVVSVHMRQMGTAINEYLAIVLYAPSGQMPDSAALEEMTGHTRNSTDKNCRILEHLGLIQVIRQVGHPNRYTLVNAPKLPVDLTAVLLEGASKKAPKEKKTKIDKPRREQTPEEVAHHMIFGALGRVVYASCTKEVGPVDRKGWLTLPHDLIYKIIQDSKTPEEVRGVNPKTFIIRKLDEALRPALAGDAGKDAPPDLLEFYR